MRALLDALRDKSPAVRAAAARALARRDVKGEETEAALLACLADPSAEVRRAVCASLRWVFEPTVGVPALLRRMAEDPEEAVRAEAARALGIYGRHSSLVVPALREALRREKGEVRVAAAGSLALRSQDPADQAEAREALRGTRGTDRHEQVRGRAAGRVGQATAEAVSTVSPDPATARATLQLLVTDANLDVRIGAVPGLLALGEEGWPWLMGLLQDADPLVRNEVVAGLPAMGIGGGREVAVLDLLRHPSGDARCTAVTVLAELDIEAAEVGRHLLGMLRDPESMVRHNAARVLLDASLHADAAVHTLEACLDDPESFVSVNAATVLAHKGRGSPRVLALLIEAAGSGSPPVNEIARRCLARLAHEVPAAREALARLGAERSGHVDLELALATIGAGEVSPEALRIVLDALHARWAQDRVRAAWALCKLDAPPPGAVEAVRETIMDADLQVRVQAAYTLARWGMAPPEAAGIFAEGLRSSDDWVRGVATDGLRLGRRGSALLGTARSVATRGWTRLRSLASRWFRRR